MGEKITGYLLLVVGLTIMVFSVINMFMVFTNKAKPFSVFNIQSNGSTNVPGLNDLVSQLQKNNPNASQAKLPKIDILPPEVLNQTLNLSTHFFLISFMLGFGYKLASLGVQLIRTINVRLKSHLLEVMNDGSQSSPQSTSPQSVQLPQPIQPKQT